MLKHVIVVVASAVLGAACGIQNLDALGGEADVEIINADAGDTADGEDTEADGFSSLGSATDGTATDGDADDNATDQDNGEDALKLDEDDEASGAENAPVTQNAAGLIEVADRTMVSLVGSEDRMTLNPEKPTGGWGYLTVDRAYTTAMVADVAATDGNKFVAVEYQLLSAENGNFFDETFRLLAGGRTYSPANNINEIGAPGGVVNDVVFFEVPIETGEVQLEGGVISGSSDGFTAVYDIGFRKAEASDGSTATALADDEVDAIVGDIQVTSPDARMTMDTSQPTGGWGTLTVHGGMATAKIEDTSAGAGFKFLALDVQVLGQERDNLFDEAFRVEADGELYQTLTGVNEVLAPGQVYNSTILFRVPRETTDFVLEAGVPERWTDGLRTTVSFSLWDPSEGITEPEPTDVAAEAEATAITLVGDEQRMTTDPSDARGWGTLTVDRAYTTAKIEQNGAREGFKFLIVEYQLLGGERDNFFDEAFRMEANGELYSPRNGINEIVGPGEVFNGSVVFEVPLSAVSVVLEGGAVPGSTDGFTTNYNISFG